MLVTLATIASDLAIAGIGFVFLLLLFIIGHEGRKALSERAQERQARRAYLRQTCLPARLPRGYVNDGYGVPVDHRLRQYQRVSRRPSC